MKLIILLLISTLALIGAKTSQILNIRNLVTQNCLKYNNKKVCIQFYFRYALMKKECVKVNDLCKTWSNTTALCTSCYKGWQLKNGKCVITGPEPTKCYFRQVYINGKCVQVSDLCKEWNQITALCTLCYQGYKLTNGVCHV